jgi:DNA-binding LacI/PurR family transcriptional regulator
VAEPSKTVLHVKPACVTLPRVPRVGIKEVARAAGVSVTTVSHALNGKGRLPEETRERVRRVALELGYRPSRTARNLVGGRTGLMGLTVSHAEGVPFALSDFAYFTQLMSAAATAAIERNYALVLAPPAVDRDGWLGVDVDGAIIVDPVRDDPLVNALHRARVPVVTTGRVAGGAGGDPWVDNDHAAGTRSVLDHLARRGARRIALVTSPPVTSYTIDSEAAYRAWCDEHGHDALVAYAREDLTEGAGYAATSELLGRSEPIDGIYATLDRLALGALLAAEARGIRVPDDLLLVGNTDSDAARLATPSLTALSLHPDAIARRAVDLLADLIEGIEPATRNVIVPTRIVARASTRRSTSGAVGRRP